MLQLNVLDYSQERRNFAFLFQSSTSHKKHLSSLLPHYVILAEHIAFHAYLYIQVYMGMSKHLSWVVREFYSGFVAALWIMCSSLVEGLGN